MIILLQEFTGEWFTPEEKRRQDLFKKWSFLDSIQYNWIKFKKIFIFYNDSKGKFIVFGKLRKNVLEMLQLKGYIVKRFTKTSGGFYYYIYF